MNRLMAITSSELLWGFTSFELLTVAVSAAGMVWWLAAMYWQVKQGTHELQKISRELHEQQLRLNNHEIRLMRVENRIGVPWEQLLAEAIRTESPAEQEVTDVGV